MSIELVKEDKWLSSAALAMTSLYKDSTVSIKHRCERFVQMKWRRRRRRPEVARAGRRWGRSDRRRRPTTNRFLTAKNLPRFEPLTPLFVQSWLWPQCWELTSWDADFELKHRQCCGLDVRKFFLYWIRTEVLHKPRNFCWSLLCS